MRLNHIAWSVSLSRRPWQQPTLRLLQYHQRIQPLLLCSEWEEVISVCYNRRCSICYRMNVLIQVLDV